MGALEDLRGLLCREDGRCRALHVIERGRKRIGAGRWVVLLSIVHVETDGTQDITAACADVLGAAMYHGWLVVVVTVPEWAGYRAVDRLSEAVLGDGKRFVWRKL